MKLRTIGLLVLGVALLAACGAEGGDDTTTTAAPDTTSTTSADAGQEDPTTTTAPEADDTTTTAAETMEGVHVADTDLGSILVDPDGFTLYIFTADSEGESTCYDACADLWPPVPADTPISSELDDSIFGAVTRDDGTEQLAVNGMPLYLYTPDENPGDTTGQGFNDVWFVVDPDGNMMEAAATSTNVSDDEDDPDYGYDY